MRRAKYGVYIAPWQIEGWYKRPAPANTLLAFIGRSSARRSRFTGDKGHVYLQPDGSLLTTFADPSQLREAIP